MAPTLRVTFIRTSCLLLECEGRRAITDPWFSPTMWGVPVYRKPGVPIGKLPYIDYVIASHLHPDHFDRRAVAHFGHSRLAIAGTVGTAARCEGLRVGAVTDLLPWQTLRLGPFHLTATPAVHTGPPPPEINFIIRCGGLSVFFGGDARLSEATEAIAERFAPVDVALVPIGGTLIFGSRTTMSPDDAARACAMLGARCAVPIHEGGEWFSLPPASWHPGRNAHFVEALARRAPGCEARALAPGQSTSFSASPRARAAHQPSR